MADYCLLEDVQAYGFQVRPEDQPLLGSIITRASRIFDQAAGAVDSYFAEGDSAQTASARVFWGDGMDHLRVDPFLADSITSVTMPDTYTVPDYFESTPFSTSQRKGQSAGEFFLVRTYGDDGARLPQPAFTAFSDATAFRGWPEGIQVTVTAKWGWAAVPQDVQEAVIETAIMIWRGRDQAFARAVAVDGQLVFSSPLPQRAKLVADAYRGRRMLFA